MKFVDQIRIHVKAGEGGNGCSSMRREKFIPFGGPDGGDGGKGSDIIFQANEDTDSLVALYYEPIIRGKKGANGQGSDKTGRSAAPTYVKVPVGTIIYRLPEDAWPGQAPAEFQSEYDLETEEDGASGRRRIDPRTLEPLADLAEKNQEFVLCKGGDGGRGNASFKSSKNRAPRMYTEGKPGEEGWFVLELRTIADFGLVGFPNAGKSTLLGSLSSAHPKVAAYPFTTLHPHVGVVELPEYRRVTVADIPGLIDGAHENKGLGHEFLRHILRCRRLLFVLDMAGSEGRDPLEDLANLRRELDLYDVTLSGKAWSIIANKMDLPGAEENLAMVKQRFGRVPILPISGKEKRGIEAVKEHLASVADE